MLVELIFRFMDGAREENLRPIAEGLGAEFSQKRDSFFVSWQEENPVIKIRRYDRAKSTWTGMDGEAKGQWEEVFEQSVNGISLPVRPYIVDLDGEQTQVAGHFGVQNFQYPE